MIITIKSVCYHPFIYKDFSLKNYFFFRNILLGFKIRNTTFSYILKIDKTRMTKLKVKFKKLDDQTTNIE